jgi:Immunity protein 42
MKSTLSVDLSGLSRLGCMRHTVEDDRLFSLSARVAYAELCAQAFPSSESDVARKDFSYFVSVESLSDEGYNVFLVESMGEARLIYGLNEDVESVNAVVLRSGEFQSVVREIVAETKSLLIGAGQTADKKMRRP